MLKILILIESRTRGAPKINRVKFEIWVMKYIYISLFFMGILHINVYCTVSYTYSYIIYIVRKFLGQEKNHFYYIDE